MTWEHGVRFNHILPLDTSAAHGAKDGDIITVTKPGRRVYADGPILFCDKSWWMLGYCRVLTQSMTSMVSGVTSTVLTVEILTKFSEDTARLVSVENAKAQRAAGNYEARPESFEGGPAR